MEFKNVIDLSHPLRPGREGRTFEIKNLEATHITGTEAEQDWYIMHRVVMDNHTDLRARIREATLASGRKVVVLDDDPTGTQTVHDLPVLTEWTPQALAEAWAEAETTFYILTNTRRYPLERAAAMNREIGRNLAQVDRQHGVEPVVVSRSDSTLRGHYPGEVSALAMAINILHADI